MTPTFSSKPFFNDDRQFKSAVEDQDGASFLSEPARNTPSARTAYYFPKGVGEYHFGEKHPMKPHRLTLTNHLVMGYGLHKDMDIYQPRLASKEELTAFHAEDYIDFLSRATPDNIVEFSDVLGRFNIGEDCPIFDSLFDYCQQYSGASLAAARRLASGSTDIAVNWTGGLHHAKKLQASGFCYINDIVLAILELLRIHPRVLYIDIDIHHGDGVQEAFYNSNRVLTVSFHKYAEHFFPGTGHIDELGSALGQYFSLNVPLQDGIDNESYISLFKSVMEPAIHTFQPSAIVLQCGADSLGCDRLGAFNLSISAHGECVRFIKDFKIPLMVVGGGGYTVKNVARCWTYETAVLLDKQKDISNSLPSTVYDDFFAPDYKLHPPLTGRVENNNTRAGLERIRVGLLERIRFMQGAPSVQLQEVPPSLASWLEQEEEKLAKDPDAHRDARNAYDSWQDQDHDPTPDQNFVKPLPPQASGRGRGGRRSLPNPERKRKRPAGSGNKAKPVSSKQSATSAPAAADPQTMDVDENASPAIAATVPLTEDNEKQPPPPPAIHPDGPS